VLVDENNDPWFIESEVYEALGIKNPWDAFSRLDEDEKLTSALPRPGQKRKTNLVNESGLYELVFISRKPEAKAFKKWVKSEVIPSIRKNRVYMTSAVLKDHSQNQQLNLNLTTAVTLSEILPYHI